VVCTPVVHWLIRAPQVNSHLHTLHTICSAPCHVCSCHQHYNKPDFSTPLTACVLGGAPNKATHSTEQSHTMWRCSTSFATMAPNVGLSGNIGHMATSQHQPFPHGSDGRRWGPAENGSGGAATNMGNRLLLATPCNQPGAAQDPAAGHQD